MIFLPGGGPIGSLTNFFCSNQIRLHTEFQGPSSSGSALKVPGGGVVYLAPVGRMSSFMSSLARLESGLLETWHEKL